MTQPQAGPAGFTSGPDNFKVGTNGIPSLEKLVAGPIGFSNPYLIFMMGMYWGMTFAALMQAQPPQPER